MYSVVIPVYQAEKTLSRCVTSWLKQSRGDLELLLVDDGSTDGSGALCDRLEKEDARIRVIHQANAGVSAARNAGIRAAAGEYLLFTDSDDYVAPDYLERMAVYQEETDADLTLCGFHHLYDGADILKIPGKTRALRTEEFSADFLALYEKSYLNMPWNKLYRRSLAGQFDESISLGEDLLFNLDFLRRCQRIGVLAEPLCYYIQEERRATLSSQKRRDRLSLARRISAETERFYQETWGARTEASARIFTRYMNEVFDECEKLPADRSRTLQKKLSDIRDYADDEWVRTRGDEAVLAGMDYRILWIFLKRRMARTVYALCVLRRAAVVILHGWRKLWNR